MCLFKKLYSLRVDNWCTFPLTGVNTASYLSAGVCSGVAKSDTVFSYNLGFVLPDEEFHEDLRDTSTTRYQELTSSIQDTVGTGCSTATT